MTSPIATHLVSIEATALDVPIVQIWWSNVLWKRRCQTLTFLISISCKTLNSPPQSAILTKFAKSEISSLQCLKKDTRNTVIEFSDRN